MQADAGGMEIDLVTDPTPAYEHHGLPWRPKLGATSSFEEFRHAREHVVEIWNETDWNPWRKEELAPQMERAFAVDDEWECADPNWRPLTRRQMGARMAAGTRRYRAERKATEARWERDKGRYDPNREKARYALLERQPIQTRLERDLAQHRARSIYPAMPEDRRALAIAELEDKLARNANELERLTAIVGDPEDVVDEDGKLPADRREWNVSWYRYLRTKWVEELQLAIAAQKAKIAETKDRREKFTLGIHLHSSERRLAVLLAIPRLSADQMCADCYTPAFQHASGGDIYESHPCPHWPMHAARMERAWEILRSARERIQRAEPEPPKPQPLATLPAKLPIAEVIAQLQELQAQHPDAVVKRGRANRWELWPPDTVRT